MTFLLRNVPTSRARTISPSTVFSTSAVSPLLIDNNLKRKRTPKIPSLIYVPPKVKLFLPSPRAKERTPMLYPQPPKITLGTLFSPRFDQEVMILPFDAVHVNQVEVLLLHSFLEENQFGMGISATDFAQPYQDYASAALKYGASYVAMEQRYGSVVGCAMLTIQERGAPPTEKVCDFHHCPLSVQNFMGFFKRFEAILFRRSNLQKLAKLNMICVEVNHRQGKVGRKLMDSAISDARCQNCDAIIGVSLSPKEQCLANDLGFVTLKTLDLLQGSNHAVDQPNGDLPFANIPEENRYAKLLIKYLSASPDANKTRQNWWQYC